MPRAAPPIEGVTFDLWATLMHSNREDARRREELRAERIHEALRRAGQPRDVEDVRAACDEIWGWLEATYWSRNLDPGFDAQIEWLRQRFGVPAENGELVEALRDGFVEPIFEVPPRPDAAAEATLQRTHEMGLKVALICNTSVTPGTALRRLLAEWGLEPLLPVQLYSCEVGIRKPAPEIFQEAARRLDIKVTRMLHVGDQVVNDIEGAIGAGAQAIQVGKDLPLERVSDIIATKLNK